MHFGENKGGAGRHDGVCSMVVRWCGRLAWLSVLVAGPAAAEPPWPDDPLARLEALALIQTLNADLLSHDSATLTLDRWCGDHRLASPALIVADRDSNARKLPSDEQRSRLRVDPAEPVRYRSVRLRCGTHVLSEADNFYVPGRLTLDINRQLDTTDVAFGRAIQPLHVARHTFAARLLWEPLPHGWEMGVSEPGGGAAAVAAGGLAVPPHVLEHEAVLTLPDGTPISLVVERYTGEVLGFPPPPRP